jgi:hypothetical protein
MELLILLPSLFVLLYCLYKLFKDDYVFMRKNVSAEQAFDVAFNVIWVSLISSRLVYLLLHPQGQNLLLSFFSAKIGGLSFVGAIIGGIIMLYLISKYKKLPLGRLSDFFTISFLVSLPLAFLSNAFLHKKIALLFDIFNAAIYFLLVLFFTKVLYPKLMQRTLKEGNITIFFILFFSFVSFGSSLLIANKKIMPWMDPQNFLYLGLFLLGIILLIKQGMGKGRKG